MSFRRLIRGHIKKISVISEFVYNGSLEIKRALTDCQSVLDVGCGGGDAYSFCHEADLYSVGIDIDPRQLQRARAADLYNELVQGDVRTLGNLFAPKSFDAVLALDLIEHVPRAAGGIYGTNRKEESCDCDAQR